MNGALTGQEWGKIGVLVALFVFGILYNHFVNSRPRVDREAFVSIYVVLGVAVTLVGAAIIDLDTALWTTVCFVASGLPMLLGSINKYSQQRKYEMDALKEEIERKQ